jgi:vancomycin permeability regulator SanA
MKKKTNKETVKDKKKTEDRPTKRRRRIKRMFLCVFIVFVLCVSSFFAIQIYVVQSTKNYVITDAESAPVCDAVMVLGALVYDSGPSPLLRDRLDYGLELYMLGKAKKILVSGDHGQSDYDEVNAMRQYLLDKGVPSEDIFMDHAGFNTYDSMYRAKEIFGIESLLISTQEFHINRSIYIARGLGIDAYGYQCEDPPYGMKKQYVREYMERVKAFVDVAIKRPPKYLGDPIPIDGDGSSTEG